MYQRIKAGRSQQSLMVEVIDTLAIGLVVCDGTGQVAMANAAALQLARSPQCPFSLTEMTFSAINPDQAQLLCRLVESAADGIGGGAIALISEDGMELVLALVCTLPKSLKEKSRGHALIALRRASEEVECPAQVLRETFRLSASQADLALALYNGSTVGAYADARGVKISTVRSHLAEILLKTRTGTQRDLVRLIGMLPPVRLGR